jgi:hypothetical protein
MGLDLPAKLLAQADSVIEYASHCRRLSMRYVRHAMVLPMRPINPRRFMHVPLRTHHSNRSSDVEDRNIS